MRYQHLLLSLVLSLGGHAYAGGEHRDDDPGHQPQHGGIVSEAQHMDFELVARGDVVTLHVRDHGQSAKVDGATAKVTVLSGKVKTRMALKASGPGQLSASGQVAPPPGSKVLAVVSLPGKKLIQVRFVVK
ncbi:MAG TPA: hypothetical protein VFW84_12470 [Aquabacterium sp.]|uniref:hypothetical protein n=1 Tax=Aquabacterium sp. TaxID=1872578 RepID=UPI002DB4798D|nr:hypothetical protein [Aquabacterium sp.]HET6787171.1 hypothetical protein [Aquabacterium sp.]HEX5373537.1 hypothetical protein [Aquabacterium sp.]